MGELVAIVVLLLAVIVAIFVLTNSMNQPRTGVTPPIARTRWRLEEHITNGVWSIDTVRLGESNEEATVRCNDPDFDSKVEEARINAETRLHTLNRALPR